MDNQDQFIDIDSTYRNRNNYPNPYNFVIPYEFPNKGSTGLSFFDPILSTTPYTGSLTKNPGELVTQTSIDQSNITLDSEEINIDNFYINRTLQIGEEFGNIIAYDGTTKIATVDEPFNVLPAPGTLYNIRNTRSYYNSNIALILPAGGSSTNTVTQFNLLNVDPAVLNNFFEGSFIRFTNGIHKNKTAALVVKYEPSGNIFAWEQDNALGVNDYMSTILENGFRFIPTKSGQLSTITIRFTAFESIDPYRTFILKIMTGAGLGNPILYQNTFDIPNTNIPTDFDFTIVSGPNLYNSSYYTLSLIDTTSGGSTTGFINMFGISPDTTNVTYNCNVYPKQNINVYPVTSIPIWIQPNEQGSNSYLDTLIEQGFTLTVPESGIINQILINLISFESISSGRTITLKIRQGIGINGTVLYQQNYTISNYSDPTNYVFNVSGSLNLIANSPYTITLLDITSGGTISGYVNILGILNNSSYPTTNIITFPKMSIIYTPPETSIWNQNLDTGIDGVISTTYEQGYRFTSGGTGIISTIKLFLTSFDLSGTRNLRLKIREGLNINGNIMYNDVFTIPNYSNPQSYTINIPSGPSLSASSNYTFTLQDITAGGLSSGFINIFGIPSNTSYNSSLYPFTEISCSLGGTANVWTQNITSGSNPVTTETGYAFTPSSSGVLTDINLKFKTNNVSTSFILTIREGSGNNGSILYQQSYTYNIANFTLIDIPTNSGPFLSSGETYTLTLQSSELTFLIAGDPANSTYIVYGTGNYPNLNIILQNGFSIWKQDSNPTYSSLIDSTEKGFQFTAEGSGTYMLTSLNLELFSFSAGSSRTLTINIRNGSGLSNPILFSTNFSVSDIIGRSIVNIPVGYSSITAGSVYTISITDNFAGNNGYMYFYGINPNITYISYNTTTYPLINIKGNITTIGFSQNVSQTILSDVSTLLEEGFGFTPSSAGQFSSFDILLSSFESSSSGRTLSVKVRDGFGISGNIVYSSTFLISNHSSKFNFNFQAGNTSYLSAANYTLTIQDITSGGQTTGNVYIYGITPGGIYTSFNNSVYPKLSIYSSVAESISSQQIDLNNTDVISDSIEQTFSIVPILPGILNSITLNLTSFSTIGGRTLLMTLYNGIDNTYPIVVQQYVIIQNINPPRRDFSINITTPYILEQNDPYTLSFVDVTGGTNNGGVWIYGIVPTQKYSVTNISVYPRIRLVIPSYTITVTPPQDLSAFLANNQDNIEFNTQAFENATTLYVQIPPSKFIKYCEIELLNIILPYQLLNTSQGGYFNNYPYIYLCLYDEGESLVNVLTSNNPNSTSALFKINTKYDQLKNFIKLKGNKDIQRIKFRPNMDLRLTLYLPDGSIMSNNLDDRLSPLFPNPFLQVSVSLRIKYIDQN